jgi:hypothetical protein
MAIRFIDTKFFQSPFVRGLEGSLKGLYTYIICECSGAGIWSLDLEVSAIYTGFKYTEIQFKKAFIDTGKAIDLKDGKVFFPDFIEHQYPNGLQGTNPAHKNFIKELTKYNLLTNDLKVIKGASKGLQSPLSNSIGNSNSLSKGKVTVMYYREFSHLKLTIKEFETLKSEGFSVVEIDNILDEIQNYKKNTNYTSLLLTARKWMKKNRLKEEKPKSKIDDTAGNNAAKSIINDIYESIIK